MISTKFSKTQNTMGILITLCVFLQLLRVQLTQEFFFSFLLWNLFLAVIPYVISEMLKTLTIEKLHLLKLLSLLSIWLLFLPNAPYIITDFVHLHHSKSIIIWYDIFLLFCFANTGLLLALLSITDIYKVVAQKWNKRIAENFILTTAFLCGFGVYLGRFLRFNSWDIITSPIIILKKSVLSATELNAWLITMGFGSLLWVLFTLFKTITQTRVSTK